MRPELKVEIRDGVEVITWTELHAKLGPGAYGALVAWLYGTGQTVTPHGAYPQDVDRYFDGAPVSD